MKKIIAILFSILLIGLLCFSVSAETRLQPRLVDYADVLSDSEEEKLMNKLDEISNRQKFDVAVVTVLDTNNMTPSAFADDYFDYNGFGFGDNHDGAVLVIDMGSRNMWISGCGRGEENINSDVIDKMGDEMESDLSSGNYYNAINTYADMCDEYCNGPGYNWFFGIAISLVIGFVIAFIATGVMKGQLKSVRFKAEANDYLVPGSLNITSSRDMFLYRNVTRRAKPKDTSSGSHTSSSGRSHSGGGRSF